MGTLTVVNASKYRITMTGLELLQELSYDEWFALGHDIRNLDESFDVVKMWTWGDWMCYGEGKYGERFSQALQLTGKAPATLRVWKWVAERTPAELRGYVWLKQRHYIVALREKNLERRRDLLAEANKNQWSVNILEQYLPPDPDRPGLPSTTEDSGYQAIVEADRLELQLVQAARSAGRQNHRAYRAVGLIDDVLAKLPTDSSPSVLDPLQEAREILTRPTRLDADVTASIKLAVDYWRQGDTARLARVMDQLAQWLAGQSELTITEI